MSLNREGQNDRLLALYIREIYIHIEDFAPHCISHVELSFFLLVIATITLNHHTQHFLFKLYVELT